MSLKDSIKKMLGHGPIRKSVPSSEEYTGALRNFCDRYVGYANSDRLAPRKDFQDYNEAIKRMEPAFNFFNDEIYKENPDVKEVFEYDNFHSGTPLKHAPFKPCLKNMRATLRHKNLYWYPRTPGGYRSQQKFLEYLEREGIITDRHLGVGVDNIVFTCSTTHAYSLILKTIAKENDVILMTAPNYGLFAIIAELGNYHLETIDLKEEDNWFVNPKALGKRIDEINQKLKKTTDNEAEAPKVAAFLNLNPHNPIGNVMNKKNCEILEGIAEVCQERNVFIIDDLVYRDLTYDQDDLALPVASYPRYFNNVISLFGLSKAYNLASVRAAVVLAPLPVAHLITNELHDTMDSMPVLQVAATVGAFNGSNSRYRNFKRYINPIIQEYQYRFNLLYALVYGINKIKDEKLRVRIRREIRRYVSMSEAELLFRGCKGIKIKIVPQSGFFAVFDFTDLKGMKTPAGKILKTEEDLLGYFYSRGGVKYLMGGNIFWPIKDEFVGRISFALDKKAIVRNMLILNRATRELEDESQD